MPKPVIRKPNKKQNPLNAAKIEAVDNKDTALFSNDGGSGCTTCGYNFPSPPGIPIGVFNAGNNFLSGVSGGNRLTTQWLTFDGSALFNAITQQQQALLGPGFTFAPPKVNGARSIDVTRISDAGGVPR